MTRYDNGLHVYYEKKGEIKDESTAFWLNRLNSVPITELKIE
jgi:hypothetical protein